MLNCECNSCKSGFSDKDDIFCATCWDKLESDYTGLQTQIEEQAALIDDLKAQIDELKKDLEQS